MIKDLEIWDQRMFQLCEQGISKGIIKNERDFLLKIGFKNVPNVYQIKDGRQSFRHYHLLAAADFFDVSLDWIYGRTSKKNFKSKEKASATELLEDALYLLKKTK